MIMRLQFLGALVFVALSFVGASATSAQAPLLERLGHECSFSCKEQFRALEALPLGEGGIAVLERVFKSPTRKERLTGAVEYTFLGDYAELFVQMNSGTRGIDRIGIRPRDEFADAGKFVRIPNLLNLAHPDGEVRRFSDWNVGLVDSFCQGTRANWEDAASSQFAIIAGCTWPAIYIHYAFLFERTKLQIAGCKGLGAKIFDPAKVKCPQDVSPTMIFVGLEIEEWASNLHKRRGRN